MCHVSGDNASTNASTYANASTGTCSMEPLLNDHQHHRHSCQLESSDCYSLFCILIVSCGSMFMFEVGILVQTFIILRVL